MRAERPLFRAVTKGGKVTGQALSDKAVVRLVKQAADARLDGGKFSGHSLLPGDNYDERPPHPNCRATRCAAACSPPAPTTAPNSPS